jgi:hypothetical protein
MAVLLMRGYTHSKRQRRYGALLQLHSTAGQNSGAIAERCTGLTGVAVSLVCTLATSDGGAGTGQACIAAHSPCNHRLCCDQQSNV